MSLMSLMSLMSRGNKHHLVGGYVRYISPHITCIIIITHIKDNEWYIYLHVHVCNKDTMSHQSLPQPGMTHLHGP